MPDIIIINDNASFTTSSSSSTISILPHTTTHPPTITTHNPNTNTYPHPTLRRKPTTVQRLSTWVTKKISKPRLNDFLHTSDYQTHDYENGSFEGGYERGYGGETVGAAAVRDTSINEYAYEDHDHDHEEKLYESYAAFCDAFTSSGVIGVGSEMKRRKKERNKKENMVIQTYIQPNSTSAHSRPASTVISTSPAPTATTTTTTTYTPDDTNERASVSCEMAQEISPVDSGCYSSSSFSFERSTEKELSLETGDDFKPDFNPGYCHSHSTCPTPPPEVLTPALYAQMSRDSRQARKSKRWWLRGSAVRLWFSCGRNETNS